ncbi:DUF2577 domain-containing protein [Paenibacillus glucanolyticus]|jgi:hypothetical protein|uniref:DUF2577 family protein n=1 Tax=Paenibacillus TaxID=44249 RepID=UPI0003E1BAD2|nr:MULTISPECIES: DUF2577 family protein [Paenibacillus]ANA80151.1 hypothetical protein A3958_09220 [Paenibacillus glucanolyticus]AVV55782.1 DUF2577 domain-containing protein [Paenibacillus glucanolyticus]ETT38560.1 hypothetical protein C169_13157 [Paenibacillus sp. FSL R5-808]
MTIELIEGGGFSQLKHVVKTIGHNKDVDIEFATVLAPLPGIRIKIDNMPVELDADDVVVCEHLRDHMREVTINSGEIVELAVLSPLKSGDRVAVAMYAENQGYLVLDRI